MDKSLAKFSVSQHIHQWVVDAVKHKYITKVRTDCKDD